MGEEYFERDVRGIYWEEGGWSQERWLDVRTFHYKRSLVRVRLKRWRMYCFRAVVVIFLCFSD